MKWEYLTIAMGRIYCEVCGGQNATEAQELIAVRDEFVNITVISCPDCELNYTDYRAEAIREIAQ